MDQRNPYNNPHFRNEVQQPDAPEPQSRVQNAVDLLTDPRIPRMRERRYSITSLFFVPDRDEISDGPEYQNFNLRSVFGPQVFSPPPPRQPQGGQLGTFWQEQDANKNKKKKWYTQPQVNTNANSVWRHDLWRPSGLFSAFILVVKISYHGI